MKNGHKRVLKIVSVMRTPVRNDYLATVILDATIFPAFMS
jgi:hypothetical protein